MSELQQLCYLCFEQFLCEHLQQQLSQQVKRKQFSFAMSICSWLSFFPKDTGFEPWKKILYLLWFIIHVKLETRICLAVKWSLNVYFKQFSNAILKVFNLLLSKNAKS